MRIIDLSQTMEPGMPQYPGQPDASFTRISTVEHDGYQVTDFHAVVHVGTHCDAPAHFIAGGETMDHVPLDRFVGEAMVVDVPLTSERELGPSVLDGVDVRAGDILLFRSGMPQQWGSETYLTTYPFIGEALAKKLVALGVKAIGLDFISPDPVESTTFIAHHTLLGNRLGIVENLRNLDALPTGRLFFSAAPIKVKGCDGGFARAFAALF